MTVHSRTCSGDHQDHLLRLELGAGIPPNLRTSLTREVRAILQSTLDHPESLQSEDPVIPECAVPEVTRAIDAFLAARHYDDLGVQKRQDTLFVGDATPDLPEPAVGRFYPER